ncbi:MAG: hypothetical protein ACYC3I_09535 [Gemmataceae bacterium]
MASLATLWFFSCIPVVAMGQVVLVCQFLVISGLYLTLMLFQRYLESRIARWLLLAALVVFVFGLYGESMLIAPLAVGAQGLILFLRRNFGSASRAFAFAGLGCFLVLGNSYLLTGDPSQFTRGLRSVLCTRGYDVSAMGSASYYHLLANWLIGYFHSFRPHIFTGIFFSVSPLLFVTGMASLAGVAVVKRRFVILGLLVAAAGVASWNAAWGIGAASAVFCLAYAARQPLLVSMFAAGVFVVGPVFIIDTHITYLLPAFVALLFIALFEAGAWLQAHGQRALIWCPASVLALLAVANFGSGVYFSARVANDNRQLAMQLNEAIRSGSVVVNFRHAFDLYCHANERRQSSAYEGDLHYTASVPSGGEDRAVRDEGRMRDWFESTAASGKPRYFLVVDYDRLSIPIKLGFHSPRFLDGTHFRYRLKHLHVFKAATPFFDPGFLLVNHFYKNDLSAGFIGYPIFPDMIDDIGVEYGLFTKRLFACYRLLEVTKRSEKEALASFPDPPDEVSIVLPDYLGYQVVAVGPLLVANSLTADGKHSSKPIVSDRLDVVLGKIRTLSLGAGLQAGELGF